jgi:hypothetical protein
LIEGAALELSNVTFQGPEFEVDSPLIGALPTDLVDLLRQTNGFVQFGGGLHVRGICSKPIWHSIAEVMSGPTALHKLYDVLLPTDALFAQDCMADQFLLREGLVCKLQSETGELSPLNLSLSQFLLAAKEDPLEFLAMQPLMSFQREGKVLQPGQVLQAYPPFCTKEARQGVSLRAISISEALDYLANFSRQISSVADGDRIRFRVDP